MEYNFNVLSGVTMSIKMCGNTKLDKLICEREENNPNDKFSVKLVLQHGNLCWACSDRA